MQPVLTAEASADLDLAAVEDGGFDAITELMNTAGHAVALAAVDLGATYGSRIGIMAGPGNNGGDGYVCAAYLAKRGCYVSVFQYRKPRSEACVWAANMALTAGVSFHEWSPPPSVAFDLVVDALFGGGFRSEIDDSCEPWISLDCPLISIDVPTGLNASTGALAQRHFVADRTVTFHTPKVGHIVGSGPDVSGELVVADIGLSGGDQAFAVCEEIDAPRPARARVDHKWSVGSVMVVSGDMTGAAMLAARSALRFGAGAVSIACSSQQRSTFDSLAPELLSVVAPDVSSLLEAAERFDTLVVGPGLGGERAADVVTMAERWTGNLVLDADALVPQILLAKRSGPTVLTPHAGEFRRLTGEDPTPVAARELARSTGVIVVLKGSPTFVCSARTTVAVTTGGPELASIGTGDVLSGMIAALWSRGLEPEVAARSGAFWHGVAGASLAARMALTADQLCEHITMYAFESLP